MIIDTSTPYSLAVGSATGGRFLEILAKAWSTLPVWHPPVREDSAAHRLQALRQKAPTSGSSAEYWQYPRGSPSRSVADCLGRHSLVQHNLDLVYVVDSLSFQCQYS